MLFVVASSAASVLFVVTTSRAEGCKCSESVTRSRRSCIELVSVTWPVSMKIPPSVLSRCAAMSRDVVSLPAWLQPFVKSATRTFIDLTFPR